MHQEDDELDEAEEDKVDYASMALRQLERREVESSSKGGATGTGAVGKRTGGALHSGGLGGTGAGGGGGKLRTGLSEERQKAKLAKLILGMRDLLLVYKLGTFFAMRSLPPHEVCVSNGSAERIVPVT